MKTDDVPQDHISTYAENKKAIYATNRTGMYEIVASSGWDVEEEATKQALIELKRLANEAYEEVLKGTRSTLYYHMYAQRMDLVVLSQSVGMFKWRVERHLKPMSFKRLSDAFLMRYSDALGLSVSQLKQLPSINLK